MQDELQQLRTSKARGTSSQDKDLIIDEYKRTVEYSNQELLKLKNQIEASDFLAKSENNELKKLRAELRDCRDTIKKLNSALSNKEEEFGKLQENKDSEIDRLVREQECKDNKIVSLQLDVSNLKSELSGKVSEARSFAQQIFDLKAAAEETNAFLSQKDDSLKEKTQKIDRLEGELRSLNCKLSESLKDKKMSEDREMNLKADKIVLEETTKNLRNELYVVQEKLKILANESTNRENEEVEKRTLEDRLSDSETKLRESKEEIEKLRETRKELERSLSAERELVAQNTKLMDEINNLQSRQEEYLNDIRSLKANMALLQNVNNELQNVDARFRETMRECEKCNEQNEILKTQNDFLNAEMEKLRKNLNEFEKLGAEYETVKIENDALKEDGLKLAGIAEELKECCERNERLRGENATLQEKLRILEVRIVETRKSQETERNYAKENEILKAELEKLKSLREDVELLRDENNSLKAESQKFVEEIRLFARNNEILRAENESVQSERQKLKQELFDSKNEFENLSKKYRDIENAIEMNEKLKTEAKQTSETFATELEEFKVVVQQLRTENERHKQSRDYVKSFLDEMKSAAERGSESYFEDSLNQENFEDDDDIVSSIVDLKNKFKMLTRKNEILNKRVADESKNLTKLLDFKNQVSSLKSEYVKFKNHLKHDFDSFRRLYCNSRTQICDEMRTVTHNFVKEYADLEANYTDLKNQFEYLDNDYELLKNEKDEFLTEVQKSTCNEEEIKLLKEKYVREVKEIVAGYEARLAEKDNEYEELRNKLYSEYLNFYTYGQ